MRLLSLFILLSTAVVLNAQSDQFPEKWIGLNNLFFKNKDVSTTSIEFMDSRDSFLTVSESLDQQLSFGISFRKIDQSGWYEEFNLFAMNWAKNREASSTQRVGDMFPALLRGQEAKNLRLQVGYQRGKLFPLVSRLNADVGLAGAVWYADNNTSPVSSLDFPIDTRSVGLSLKLELGLNFQIIKQLNIGYSIIPVTISSFWQETDINNPVLPERARLSRGVEFDADIFESIIEWRNFHIRYCF